MGAAGGKREGGLSQSPHLQAPAGTFLLALLANFLVLNPLPVLCFTASAPSPLKWQFLACLPPHSSSLPLVTVTPRVARPQVSQGRACPNQFLHHCFDETESC